ncbi:MAG: bifunctional diaminohydroxyphosphoribosylaminopyrimidine deaminase/5-amino-6-(5-phosphoribosylamino)uracil reductase RibD [Candidatus Micrarchaeia archaeon]|jgi:diaminohydroxyphosphoribosylaminopyrimidine deaminase/5-amino-6-(5-phosphoribosylamino)uracil reductase
MMPITDEKFMQRCLLLAQKGEGKVSPNPLVGAVLVKDGCIISEGYHEKFGSPHAEANALVRAGARAKGATLYVSLEPCSHSGGGKKTPPCVPLIIRAGVSRVVVAAKDRNPKVSGRGVAWLRAAGIKVDVGMFSDEAERQNEAFFKSITTGMPFVCIKMAQTRDGKIGVRGKRNVRISGSAFDSYSQRLRNRYDGILVGIGTVLADNPRLTCRARNGRNPLRIILDSHLQMPLKAKVLLNLGKDRLLIFTSRRHDAKKRKALEKLGAKVIAPGKQRIPIRALLVMLPKLGVHSVLVEGGAEVAGAFIRARLADKLVLCISKKKIAASGAVRSPITNKIIRTLYQKKVSQMGSDTVIEGYFARQPK